MEFTSAEITQIIIAFLALVGAIVKVVFGKKTNVPGGRIRKNEGQDNAADKKRKRNNIIFFIVCLGLSIPGMNIVRKYYADPYISISYPLNGQKVDDTLDIKGDYKNIDEKKQVIWIAVYSPKEQLFFLHDKPADMFITDKGWDNSNTIIGTNEDQGGEFDIMILLIDKKSKAYIDINKYINDVNSHGLTALPDEPQIIKEITVYRK